MARSAWVRSSARRISFSARRAPAWTLFGSAFRIFLTLWTQHLCSLVCGKTSRSARHSPSAPSPTITTGAPIPRRRRSRSSSAQSSVDSRVPSATATSSLRPSARTPTITRQHSRPCSPRRMLKCTPSAQQYTSSTSERSRCPKASRSACHWVVSRVTTEADRPAAEPNSSVNAGTKSLELSPCRYSSGSTSATFPAAPDPPGQDHALELLALAGLGVDAAVVDPRADHLDLPCAGGDLPGWGVAVAAHQPVPVLVDQLGEGGQVNVDLGLQRSCQHPAGALAGQLVQAHRQLTPGSIVCNSTQHVAAFGPRRRLPRRRPSNTVRVEGTPRSHARGSSTDFDDISEKGNGVRSARLWARLLGVERAVIERVEFDEDAEAIVVAVRPRKGAKRRCGVCGRRCPGYDQGEGPRRWAHLRVRRHRGVAGGAHLQAGGARAAAGGLAHGRADRGPGGGRRRAGHRSLRGADQDRHRRDQPQAGPPILIS